MITIATTATITNRMTREPFTDPEVYGDEEEGEHQAAQAFRELLNFMRPTDKIDVRQQATTLLAVLWSVSPDLVGGRTLADIERETEGDIDRRQLSRISLSFAKSFHFRSSGSRPRPPHPR